MYTINIAVGNSKCVLVRIIACVFKKETAQNTENLHHVGRTVEAKNGMSQGRKRRLSSVEKLSSETKNTVVSGSNLVKCISPLAILSFQ